MKDSKTAPEKTEGIGLRFESQSICEQRTWWCGSAIARRGIAHRTYAEPRPTTRALLRAVCRLLSEDTGRHATLRLTSEGISRNCMYSTIKRSFSWKWKSTPSTCREASL